MAIHKVGGSLSKTIPYDDWHGQPTPPISGDLIDISLITDNYEGAFRLTRGDFSRSIISVEPGTNRIYADDWENGNLSIYQCEMPTPQDVSTYAELPVASEAQAPVSFRSKIPSTEFQDITVSQSEGGVVTGLYHDGSNLIVQASKYYDTSGSPYQQSMFLIESPGNLSSSVVKGDFGLTETGQSLGRLAQRWITPIPAEYQTALSGTHVAGSSHGPLPGSSTLSKGPSLITADLSQLGTATDGSEIDANAFMHWKDDWMLPDVYNYSGSIGGENNDLWNKASDATFGLIIPGTRTYMVIGHQAGHKPGVLSYTQQELSGITPVSPGTPCTNPYSGIAVNGQTPYGEVVYKNTTGIGDSWADKYGNISAGGFTWDPAVWTAYYWLYDLDDIINASSVSEPRPYARGELEMPFDSRDNVNGTPGNRVYSGSFDPITKKLYLANGWIQDPENQYSQEVVVFVYDLSGAI